MGASLHIHAIDRPSSVASHYVQENKVNRSSFSWILSILVRYSPIPTSDTLPIVLDHLLTDDKSSTVSDLSKIQKRCQVCSGNTLLSYKTPWMPTRSYPQQRFRTTSATMLRRTYHTKIFIGKFLVYVIHARVNSVSVAVCPEKKTSPQSSGAPVRWNNTNIRIILPHLWNSLFKQWNRRRTIDDRCFELLKHDHKDRVLVDRYIPVFWTTFLTQSNVNA